MLMFGNDVVGSGMNPGQLSGLQAWYDASTTPVGAVSQWLDKSGNGNNTDVQGTSTKRPTNTANQLNGKNVLLFDNGDTLVATSKPSLFAVVNGANTTFVVAKRNTEAGIIDYPYYFSEAGAGRNYIRYSATAGQINFLSRANDASIVTSTGNTNTNFQIIIGRRSGTTQAISVNGGAETTNASGQDEPSVDAFYIGSRVDIDSYLDGGIAEILIYNRSLSAAEITQVNRYLSQKWGIAIS